LCRAFQKNGAGVVVMLPIVLFDVYNQADVIDLNVETNDKTNDKTNNCSRDKTNNVSFDEPNDQNLEIKPFTKTSFVANNETNNFYHNQPTRLR
jgi:hypothetical protein